MKLNLDEVEACAALTKSLAISNIHFPVIQIHGRGAENQELLGLTPGKLREAVHHMIAVQTGRIATMAFSLTPEIWQRIKGAKRDYCGAGISMWSIEPDGRVTPCAGLYHKRFTAGTIREHSLEKIVYESSITREFRSLHVKESPKCGPCELRFICGGGCHIDNFNRYGGLSSPGSFVDCDREREWYWEFLRYDALNSIRKEGDT